MKLYFGDSLVEINPSEHPIILVFSDDKERLLVGEQIKNMPLRDGERAYAQFPKGTDIAKQNSLVNDAIEKFNKVDFIA